MSARRNVWAVLVVLLLLLVAVLPVAAQDEEPLTEEEQANLALVEQLFAIYNEYDMDAMGDLMTDDVVWTWSDPGEVFLSEPIVRKGKRGALELYAVDESNAMYVHLVDAVVDDDTVRTTELWDSDWCRQMNAAFEMRSTILIRDGLIVDWLAEWDAPTIQHWVDANVLEEDMSAFARGLGSKTPGAILKYLADDAVFVFRIDPLTGKRLEVEGKENIEAYLEDLATAGVRYSISTLSQMPRNLIAHGAFSWDSLKKMGIPTLSTEDKITVEDGKITRFELLPVPASATLYARAAAQEANKEIVRSAVDAYVAADAEAIATYYAEDAVRREMSAVDEGMEAIQAHAATLKESFDDFACTLDDLTATGDKVFVQGTCTGTNTGVIDEMPATGNTVTFPVVGIYTLTKGQIVEESVVYDTADFYRQLGMELTPAE